MSESTVQLKPESAAASKSQTSPAKSEPVTAKPQTATAAQNTSESSGALSVQKRAGLSLQSTIKRPVEASNLTVVETFRAVGGERPVFRSQLQTVDNFYSSGMRPIGASTLKVSETYTVMGNRPVASNEIDDPSTLMGYID